jgi:monovalent cation/hydrogen antiporter
VIVLLGAVLALVTLASRFPIPYPIFLVIGGLGLSFVPTIVPVHLEPDLVFLVFLPPILWAAAYFTSLRDFRANLRVITLLAVGLVLATTAAVGAVARLLFPGMSWPVALTLGAIVSPPDAVAATAIARRLGIPHRVVTVLEGESLINDASALVAYRTAVALALTGGGFVLTRAVGQFVLASVGGVLIGLAVAALTTRALRFTSDSLVETALTLLAPYAAWVLAERAHTSAVLACVAGGLYFGQRFSPLVAPVTRIQAVAVWRLLIFVLNGVIFVLIGLQLGAIREAGLPSSLATVVWQGAVITATAITVRLVWVPLAIVVPRLLSPSLRRRDPIPSWRVIVLASWVAMRGIVSLAAALALPEHFPFQDEIVLLTFAVILATLVVQGLGLAPLIRLLDLGQDATLELEEARAREDAARAALARLDQLAAEPWPRAEDVDRLRAIHTQRIRRASTIDLGDGGETAQAQAALRRLRHETLAAERRTLLGLRDRDVISDEVFHRLEEELDVEAMRIGVGDVRLGGPPQTS